MLSLISTCFLCLSPSLETSQEKMPSLLTAEPMKVAQNDDAATKLKKEKFNAALKSIQSYYELIQAGAGAGIRAEPPTFGSSTFLELAGNLKDSALEIADPATKLKVVTDYVDLLGYGEKELKAKMAAGTIQPFLYHRFRYYYLDAQLLKLKLENQREK